MATRIADKVPDGTIIGGFIGDNYVTVIGEISPEASYVKEGDEFEESSIRYGVEGDKWSDAIYIKGPCGHFH